MAKQRGRKRKNDLYFGPEQEEAVVAFLASDDVIERNRIYNKSLREPFNKMAEEDKVRHEKEKNEYES